MAVFADFRDSFRVKSCTKRTKRERNEAEMNITHNIYDVSQRPSPMAGCCIFSAPKEEIIVGIVWKYQDFFVSL